MASELLHSVCGWTSAVLATPYVQPTLLVLGALFVANMAMYLLPELIAACYPRQSLRNKYGASWALVTGGSSGIGLALVRRLAADGLNVVIVAYKDRVFDENMEVIAKEFPSREFRWIAADLSKDAPTYLDAIKAATDDICIQVVFCNAGYIVTSLFDSADTGKWLGNHHCNATAAMAIAHVFLSKLKAARKPGCVAFTSSPAGFLGSPFCVLYGATKAYLTELAISIAPEVREFGIDVCAIHPSPVTSRFYESAAKIPIIEFFKSMGTSPEKVADLITAHVGRRTVIDLGFYPLTARMMLKFIDPVFLAELITRITVYLPEYKQARALANQAAAAGEAAASAASAASTSAATSEGVHQRRNRTVSNADN